MVFISNIKKSASYDIFLDSPKIRQFLRDYITNNSLQVPRMEGVMNIPKGMLRDYLDGSPGGVKQQMTHFYLEKILKYFNCSVSLEIKVGDRPVNISVFQGNPEAINEAKMKEKKEITEDFINGQLED